MSLGFDHDAHTSHNWQELVDIALRDIKTIQARQPAGRRVRVLEVGCGSGCVSLAILSKAADCVGMAIDVSSDAVALTEENANRCVMYEALSSPNPCVVRDV